MSMPPAIVNWRITAQYLFMSKKKEIFKAMQAKLEDQSTKDGSGSASNLKAPRTFKTITGGGRADWTVAKVLRSRSQHIAALSRNVCG